MSESWSELQQQSLQQQQEQRAKLQSAETPASLPDQKPSESMSASPEEAKNQKVAATALETVDAKPSAPAPPEAPKDDEDEDSQPFIPVKKQRAPAIQAVEPSPGPLSSTGVSPSVPTPTISQSSSKMTVPLASLITNPPPVTTPTSAPPAKAWATVVVKDEAKGLKEIQEAEARRAKENEKLKARPAPSASPIAPSSAKDEEVGTLLAWGLPTSLAGARGGKDSAVTSNASTPPAAAWATGSGVKGAGNGAGNGTKKATMKDIQEEEEKRKKKERDVVTAARRVSDKTPNPAPSPILATGGSAWATVGAGGKATRPSTGGSSNTGVSSNPTPAPPTGIAALPPRPSAAAIAGSGMQAAHSNATATVARPAAGQNTRRPANPATIASSNLKGPSKPAATDDIGVVHASNVSPDTLKWMRETLKGKLVKGTTVEEVIGLVLMMNEEDDIADTIYQSSTTLPGKRFAAEFMERRRGFTPSGPTASSSSSLSAAAKGGAGSAGSGAESAGSRLQPSASQDAFGFKVVKKKGKSGKA